jgi:hypothetical protein
MSKFKGENGTYLTRGLFIEWLDEDAPFSMRDTGEEMYYVNRKGNKYISLPYMFRNSVDEYDCALQTLGSWEHWKKLKGIEWFNTGKINGSEYTGLNDWIAEKELADEMKAKEVLMQAVKEGDVQAAKFMYDKKTKKPQGRPEKKAPSVSKSSVLSIAKNIKAS